MISNIEVVTIIVLSQVDYRERFPNSFNGEFGEKFVAKLSDFTKFSDQFDDESRKLPNLLIWRRI